jgi:ADP-heptose:LPS heptosyltransferase
MITAALHVLHRRYSQPCAVLGAGVWNSQLFAGHPDVASVWTFTRHMPFMLGLTWWRVLVELRRSDPSPIYVLERAPRQLARIRRMLALSGVDRARCVFASDEHGYEDEHQIDLLARVAQRTPPALDAADYPAAQLSRKAAPRLSVQDSERTEMEAWLRAEGWAGQKLVLIQPGNFRTMSRKRERWEGSGADDKAWPLENWTALLQMISDSSSSVQIVLCGAPAEVHMLHRIKSASGLTKVVTAAVPLRPLLALCDLAESMISIDTGPAHAAAALGLPVAVMYGAESPTRWLPRSPSGSAVIAIGGPPVSTRVDQISVHEVFNTWRSLPTVAVRKPAKHVLNEEVPVESLRA